MPPVAFPQIIEILNRSASLKHADVQRVEVQPLATGSIAQIHLAQSATRGRVAIKVKKPGIERKIVLDLAIIKGVAFLFSKLPAFRHLPLREAVNDICTSVQCQTDFHLEASNTERFRSIFGNSSNVRFPKVYHELSSAEIIVMDYEEDLWRLDDIRVSIIAHRRIVETALRAIYKMIFFHGIVHCDVHAGNVCYRKSGEILFLDCGLVATISRADREDFLDFFMCIALNRGRQAAEIVLRTALCVPTDVDRAGFRNATAELINSVSGLSAGEFSVARFLISMFAIQRRFGILGTPAFTWMATVLLIFEGVVRGKHPQIDFQDIAFNTMIQHRAGIEIKTGGGPSPSTDP